MFRLLKWNWINWKIRLLTDIVMLSVDAGMSSWSVVLIPSIFNGVIDPSASSLHAIKCTIAANMITRLMKFMFSFYLLDAIRILCPSTTCCNVELCLHNEFVRATIKVLDSSC